MAAPKGKVQDSLVEYNISVWLVSEIFSYLSKYQSAVKQNL